MSNPLEFHAIAGLLPLMEPAELDALAEDIRRNGLLEPIVLHEGRILDGRNRYLACQKAEVPVRTRELPADTNPWAFAWSENAERRHLSAGQRAAVYVRIVEGSDAWIAEQAKRRNDANARRSAATKARPRTKDGRRLASSPRSNERPLDRQSKNPARRAIATAAGVSPATISRAVTLKRHRPDLLEKVRTGELTEPQARRQMERDERREALRAKAAQVAVAPVEWRIIAGDCIAELAQLEPATARLIFADPPYNIGMDYGAGAAADRLSDADYLTWCTRWMQAAVRVLTPDGSLWVMINDEYAAEFAGALKGLGLTIRNWIKWYETFGVNCARKFNRCSRHIFYCVRDAQHFVFNPEAVSRPSDRQAKYADGRADPGGKLWDDVWIIPRLVGTAAERIPDFPTQIPLAITRAIVGCASQPGDLVIDPFSGSASTGVAALELGRQYLGIECNPQYCELSRLRLRATSASPSAPAATAKENWLCRGPIPSAPTAAES
ncbi:MAG: ParB N-terminal domain-containing protein [Pseudomonadales bacterium]|nr:ParB N-terminal domain-containing protein [Pseudomonadales bacterium]